MPDLVPGLDLPERIDDEGAFTSRVLDALHAVVSSEERMQSVVLHVAAQIHDIGSWDAARRGFWSSLGQPGGAIIAHDIRRFYEEHAT